MISSCPFCESDAVNVVNESFLSIKSFQVFCFDCLAKGSNATTEEEAIKRWNKVGTKDE